jgi:hypothetical protein
MPSPLDYGSTEAFRKRLLTRNLRSYKLAPYVDPNQVAYPTVLTDQAVVDSQPDPSGYGLVVFNDRMARFNVYSPDTPFEYSTGTVIKESEFEPYPNFNSSFYEPVDILFDRDPLGSNGLLSSDSFIAKIGATQLKKLFEERIAVEIYQRTVGRANIAGAASGSNLFGVLTNRIPLIEPNYQITQPANPLLSAVDLAVRLAGSYIPFSPIPGSYWDTEIRLGQPTTIQQIEKAFSFVTQSGIGKFFARLLGSADSGSQKFLSNTGPGQKSVLFKNIDMNRFKPDYDRNFFDRLGGAIVGGQANSSNYYVGSRTSDPSMVFSPIGDLPTDHFGRPVQSPVYGPSELAQLYEGVEQSPGLGPAGVPYVDGGGIEGGMTWVSPKYKRNAGKYVGPGGKEMGEDPDFDPSTYDDSNSTRFRFRTGSILDETQRIVESQPAGAKRFEHVGNAIDQVSKVFSDGYKEMTKGSRVISYVGEIGNEVGAEYCRVFTKDTPFLQYNDLQKTDGMTTEGRRFSYSVFDKTYNLNIAPNRRNGGQDSSNLIGGANGAYAKKYMFSIENLAWRTSKMFEDLADCEKGPNGGRVMWFPPYGLTVNENVSTGWNTSEFLGRPEPIYTYKSTQRTGTLSWKIIVDHPSVLNVIVNKVLKDQTKKNIIDGLINSFMAGCTKYDLYELAKKYATINRSDLYEIQRMLTNPTVTKEEILEANAQLNVGIPAPTNKTNPSPEQKDTTPSLDQYKNSAVYFENDIPKKGAVGSYGGYYTTYVSPTNQATYTKNATGPNGKKDTSATQQVQNMFSSGVIESFKKLNNTSTFYNELKKILDDGYSVVIDIEGGASAPATANYNNELGQRRGQSLVEYYKETDLKKYITDKKTLTFNIRSVGEQGTTDAGGAPQAGVTNVQTLGTNQINCTSGKGDVGDKDIYTRNAMACRRAKITNIRVVPKPSDPQQNITTTQTISAAVPAGQAPQAIQGSSQTNVQGPVETVTEVQRDNITKRVLRKFLTECDYFEVIKEETPMVYDNLKDKLQFFDPAFHSMTPEGLNSRLTFLQQCMRPGESIPTIKEVNGQTTIQYDQAMNTAFGAPPILILRVGDFYNIKIAPTSLGITYEPLLDINPEGIGVQPMIANITLGFNFLGGAGLKEPVDKLQNALSFNYYANTEIYDERADATDIESAQALDAEFIKSVQANETLNNLNAVNSNDAYNGKGNSETIGVITRRAINDSQLDTGDINYKDIMNVLLDSSQTFFTNTINQSKTIVSQYGGVMLQQWGYQRYYMEGLINSDGVTANNLIGKSQNIEKRMNKFFTDYETSINNGSNGFINYLESTNFNFSNKLIRVVKKNFASYINERRSNYYNSITKIIQETTQQQLNLTAILNRLNVLYQDSGTFLYDGYALQNGTIKMYQCASTTEVDPSSQNPPNTNTYIEMQNDITKVAVALKSFNEKIATDYSYNITGGSIKGSVIKNGLNNQGGLETNVFEALTNPQNPVGSGFFWNENGVTNKIGYMIMNNVILDDKEYQNFRSKILNDIVNKAELKGDGNQEIARVFDDYWKDKIKPLYQAETKATQTLIEKFEKEKVADFMKFTPYTKNKPRKFVFTQLTSPTENQKNSIKNLGKTVNTNTSNKTWNDKVKFN